MWAASAGWLLAADLVNTWCDSLKIVTGMILTRSPNCNLLHSALNSLAHHISSNRAVGITLNSFFQLVESNPIYAPRRTVTQVWFDSTLHSDGKFLLEESALHVCWGVEQYETRRTLEAGPDPCPKTLTFTGCTPLYSRFQPRDSDSWISLERLPLPRRHHTSSNATS